MARKHNLLIVESPTKARTIKRLLDELKPGGSFTVLSSRGHIKDLPKSKLGVDITTDNGRTVFTPHYLVIRGKAPVVRELKTAARKAQRIYLACDPDREGEAIAFHIAETLGASRQADFVRLLYYEVTRAGLVEALATPAAIDLAKVDAHRARRVLDRLVGYLASPLLWKTVHRGLSAGRVQTVALRLIAEREREIEKFVPATYWVGHGDFRTAAGETFRALLKKVDGAEAKIESPADKARIEADLVPGTSCTVSAYQRFVKNRSPQPPFTTATLQQEAARRLRFTAKKTMFLAQQLFEGIELPSETVGAVTYPRTDSSRVGSDFIAATRDFLGRTRGAEYVPERPRTFKERKNVQGAHEAVRPTSVERTPELLEPYLTPDQAKLYRLIYNRYLASQTADARYDMTELGVTTGRYHFQVQSAHRVFPGFEVYYPTDDTRPEPPLPVVAPGDPVTLDAFCCEEHVTTPPARYSEATLIKKLEHNGVGRPSTYSSIISTLFERRYVARREGRLHPSELGLLVNDILIPRFGDIFEVGFTRRMEDELDEIEAGKADWQQVVSDFYAPFARDVARVETEIDQIRSETAVETERTCPECGKPLVLRWGRFGKFLACSGFPDCRYKESQGGAAAVEMTEEDCPQCGKKLVIRTGRFGRFIACSGFPACRYRRSLEEEKVEKDCPECGKPLVVKRSRFGKFLACSGYPECRHTEKHGTAHQ